jgi:hypothetical protein
MRDPARRPPTGVAGIVILALAVVAALTAAAVLLLRSNAVPPDVLDGLTSPALFGQRTT